MAVTCPPHHWDIDSEATADVHFARCKKCGATTTFPACIELDSEEVMPVSINQSIAINPEPAEKVEGKRRGRPPKWE